MQHKEMHTTKGKKDRTLSQGVCNLKSNNEGENKERGNEERVNRVTKD